MTRVLELKLERYRRPSAVQKNYLRQTNKNGTKFEACPPKETGEFCSI